MFCSDLHLVDLGKGEPEATASKPEHRVHLAQLFDLLADASDVEPGLAGEADDVLFGVRQELMEGSIQQTNDYRALAHDPQDVGEVAGLQPEHLHQSSVEA